MTIETGSYGEAMLSPTEIIGNFRWSDLSQPAPWESWREAKIRVTEALSAAPPVALESLSSPAPGAITELKRRCALGNAARYKVASPPGTIDDASAALAEFARHLGLVIREDHRSAATAGAIAFPTIIPSGVLGQNAPSKRINIGAIGVGSRSNGVNIGGISRFNDARIIACADPIKDRRVGFAASLSAPATNAATMQVVWWSSDRGRRGGSRAAVMTLCRGECG